MCDPNTVDDTRIVIVAIASIATKDVVVFVFIFPSHNDMPKLINLLHMSSSPSVVRDSQTILLEGKTIGSNDFIHLYDTTPYMIMNGHVAARLPCDANSTSSVKVLIGQAPNLKPADLEFIKELSMPGKMCLYHVDLSSEPAGKSGIITDVAIQNPGNAEINFRLVGL